MLATANFKRRQFSFAVAALALVLGLSSCTTQPPSQTGDGWLAPGCYSNSSGAPADVAGMDIRYLGPPTTRFNIELRAERSSSGAWDFSADGTCTGSMVVRASLVRA
ncbi:MAG TPA: hypothetical protein VL068_07585, partial [Microthrixaceae bacterium]|nr:hypothetical protein [Microthrixaceae bacterium]